MIACKRKLIGYTLLEMLIVVALLGMAGAILVPTLSNPDAFKVQGAIRCIIGDLSFAQSDALAQQEIRRVYFYADGSGYVILREPFDVDTDFIYDPLAPSGQNGAYIVDFVADNRWDGVTITAVSIDGGQRFISYDELGGTVTDLLEPGTGGSIEVQSPNSHYRINIAAFTGKMTVQKLN